MPLCVLKETERLVVLLLTIKSSLAELNLALKGDLTMSDAMEKLTYALSSDIVPQTWALVAYPSLRPLTSWLTNLRARATQLAEWTLDFNVPKSVWLPGDSPLLEGRLHLSTYWILYELLQKIKSSQFLCFLGNIPGT